MDHYHYPAKIRKRRAALGWIVVASAVAVGATLPLLNGGTVLCLLVALFGLLLVMEAHRGA